MRSSSPTAGSHVHPALRRLGLVMLGACLAPGAATGDCFSMTPAWQAPDSGPPAGIGWADLDGNGWLDLVVTRGLDSDGVANQAYFNTGGTLAAAPSWTSTDTLPSGNLVLGDFDGDGDLDVAATSMRRGPDDTALYPHVVYFNNGGLGPRPDWHSLPSCGFSCAMGDPDGDGDLDLAFGQGMSTIDPTKAKPQPAVIYFNTAGIFGAEPGWRSDSLYIAADIAFADVDGDGDQDLALTGRRTGLLLFTNHDGRLETSPSWSAPGFPGARQIAFADCDGDGFPELAACGLAPYNTHGGAFYLFENEDGRLQPTPAWACSAYAEPSAVAWADADGDGDLDLGGAGWYAHLGLFENDQGKLSDTYVWSHTPGWVNQIAWADVDQDGLFTKRRTFHADGRRGLFDLGVRAIHALQRVEVDGRALSPREYCCDLTEGWVSLARPPARGRQVAIEFVGSRNLDLAVSSSRKVHVYTNKPFHIPRDVRILVLLDQHFGSNYNLEYPRMPISIKDHFARYGWQVTVTALAARVDSCAASGAQLGSRGVTVDTLLAGIRDLGYYDCLAIMPGQDHSGILGSPEALATIRAAAARGLVVSAWCRAVRVLAAADLIRGRRVVGHADYANEYAAAGAIFLGNDHPPVLDGNILTSVRSRFYRTETCEAIARAVEATRASRRR